MELADLLLWLCAIPSPTGEEGPLCDAIVARLSQKHPNLPLHRLGNSLVVQVQDHPSSRPILLTGHLDTVRTEQTGPVRRHGDQIFGCGASDMKAGLAVMLHLAENPPPLKRTSLCLVFYAGEEGPSQDNELERVLQEDVAARNAQFAVCLEPSDNELQLGCAGTLHAKITFLGRSAHSARPWQGDNAIHKALPVLRDVVEYPVSWLQVEGLSFASVLSVTVARGGMARNVVPASFEMNVNHRFPPGVSEQEACALIRQIVKDRGLVEIVDSAPAASPHRNHPIVQALGDSGARGLAAKQAWTDVARLDQHGIPAVNFGPGLQSQAHQRDEWASDRQMNECLEILLRWLNRIDGAPPST